MITNQDIIYILTLLINLLNLKTESDTDSYILFIYFVIIFIVLCIVIACISLWGALAPNSGGAEIIEIFQFRILPVF